MSSALVFIFVLGVLVVIHEFGHFIAARAVGVRVEKFSVGFGPKLFGKRVGDTEYCVSLLPLGGFVKLAGESASDAHGEPWEFDSKALWQKFVIVFAGPFMNAFLAFFLFTCIFMFGQPTLTAKIGKVMQDTPAFAAGLQEGDRVLEVSGKSVKLWEDMLVIVRSAEGDLRFVIERAGERKEITVTPRIQTHRDLMGKEHKSSFVGVAPASEMIYIKNGFFESIQLGLQRVWILSSMIFMSLGLMITGAMPFKESITGPIGIFFMTQQAAQMGVAHLFYFMGSLSVSLFVLNLLPIPVLDGGHVLFILIEKLKGSPLKDSFKDKVTQGGMVLLLAFMAVVILQDVHRFSVFNNLKNLFIKP